MIRAASNENEEKKTKIEKDSHSNQSAKFRNKREDIPEANLAEPKKIITE